MSKRRASGSAPKPPDAYTPPVLPGTQTHPKVTKRRPRPERKPFQVTYAKGKVPFKYGLHRLPGAILYSFDRPTADEFWYVLGFCKGEVEGFQKLILDNTEYTLSNARWQIWFYTGTASQVADPNLGSVDPTWTTSPTAEDLKNTCYAVVRLIQVSKNHPQMPNFIFEIKTKKCLIPSTGAVAYSELPVPQFYDWLLHPEGKNLRPSRVNLVSFIAGEGICAELVSGVARFTSHPSIEDQDVSDVEKMFALMCDGMFFYSQNQFYLVLDRPAASVATYTDAHFAMDSPPEGWREDPHTRVNQIIIEHTDRANGWKVVPKRFPVALPAGTQPRPATYRMDWLHDDSVVERKLLYLYYSYFYDFKLKLRHLASTSNRQVGEVVTQSVAARGISAQLFRIVSREKQPDNTFMDVLLEYNLNRFSEVVATPGSKIESTLPDAGATPPEVTSFSTATITEELFARQPGDVVPRARVAWTNPTYSWLEAVELHVSINGGEYRYYDEYTGASAEPMVALVDGVLQLSVPYSLKLIVRSRFGQRSPGVVAAKTFVGKTTPPADVQGLTGGANGIQVFLWWQPSADRDVRAYEIRRGAATDTWGTALFDGQTDVTTWSDEPPHGGSVRYFVKAIDVAGRYSTNATTFDVTMPVTGHRTVEVASWLEPHAATFTKVAGGGDPSLGLWYGTGNFILENCSPADGVDGSVFGIISTAFLTRTFSPATAESERAAGGHTTVGAWATAVDDPRRGGAPLWAPLPAGAQGEIWAGPSGITPPSRLSECRARLVSIEHSGSDVPANVAIAQPMFLDDVSSPATSRHYGNVFQSSSLATQRGCGVRLSSNATNYQQLVKSAPMTIDGGVQWALIHRIDEVRPTAFKTGTATTDAGGLVTLTYAYPLATGSDWLSITAIAQAAAGVNVLIDGVDTTLKTVRFRSFFTADNTAAPTVRFGYELKDNGGPTSTSWSIGAP